ncbi:MAG: hypothetical protein CMJ41_05095 [Phycisphaerae bacterium]|nr:hypothetical protein [Phycisphaerae bacterium]
MHAAVGVRVLHGDGAAVAGVGERQPLEPAAYGPGSGVPSNAMPMKNHLQAVEPGGDGREEKEVCWGTGLWWARCSIHPGNRFIGQSFLNLFEQIPVLNGA